MSTTHIAAGAMLETIRGQATWLALLRATPDKNGNGGDEVIESSYQRQPISFTAPAESIMSNELRVDFPLALTDWGSVSGWALFDAASGGNMLWYGQFETAAPVPIGSHFYVDIEGLDLTAGL